MKGALNALVQSRLYSQGNYRAMQDPQPFNKPNQIDRYVVQSHFVPFRYSQPRRFSSLLTEVRSMDEGFNATLKIDRETDRD